MINSLKEKQLKDYTKEEILLILSNYLLEQVELSRRKMIEESSFEKPSWSEYTAFQLGMQKAYQKVITFLPDRENTID